MFSRLCQGEFELGIYVTQSTLYLYLYKSDPYGTYTNILVPATFELCNFHRLLIEYISDRKNMSSKS